MLKWRNSGGWLAYDRRVQIVHVAAANVREKFAETAKWHLRKDGEQKEGETTAV